MSTKEAALFSEIVSSTFGLGVNEAPPTLPHVARDKGLRISLSLFVFWKQNILHYVTSFTSPPSYSRLSLKLSTKYQNYIIRILLSKVNNKFTSIAYSCQM